MKKISFLLIALLIAITSSFAQKKWAVKAGIGLNKVHDETAVNRDDILSMGYGSLEIGAAYSFNPYIELEINGEYDHLRLNDFNYENMTTNVLSLNAELCFNFSNAIAYLTDNQKVRRFALKGHIGPGITGFRTGNTDGTYLMPNLKTGVTGLYRLGSWGAIYLDYTSMATLEQEVTYDGLFKPTNGPANAFLNTWTVGIKGYPNWGKKKKDIDLEEDDPYHYDFRLKKKEVEQVVNNFYPKEVITIHRDTTIIIVKEAEDKFGSPFLDDEDYEEQRYIQFSNAKHDINQHAYSKLNDILFLLEDTACVVSIEAWASPTGTNTKKDNEWNMALSNRRANEVAYYLTEYGIDPSRIHKFAYYGKDFGVMNPKVYGLARKVRIRVYKLSTNQKAPWENPDKK